MGLEMGALTGLYNHSYSCINKIKTPYYYYNKQYEQPGLKLEPDQF